MSYKPGPHAFHGTVFFGPGQFVSDRQEGDTDMGMSLITHETLGANATESSEVQPASASKLYRCSAVVENNIAGTIDVLLYLNQDETPGNYATGMFVRGNGASAASYTGTAAEVMNLTNGDIGHCEVILMRAGALGTFGTVRFTRHGSSRQIMLGDFRYTVDADITHIKYKADTADGLKSGSVFRFEEMA